MFKFIDVKNVVAFAFLERLRCNLQNRRISLTSLNEYVKYVTLKSANQRNRIYTLVTHDKLEEFINKYSSMFSLIKIDNEEYIEAANDVLISDVRNLIDDSLNNVIREAFKDPTAISLLN